MNVFVLCTGRCGSVTFSKACEHFTNFSVGHESRSEYLWPSRLAFPRNHIEVDLRLAWYPGLLERVYGKQAFYVHLRRDASEVAESYRKKFARQGKGMARAWYEIMRRPIAAHVPKTIDDMVDVINMNIEWYLRDKEYMRFDIETAYQQFPDFCEAIGAKGDLDAARREFLNKYNAFKEEDKDIPLPPLPMPYKPPKPPTL